MFAEFEISGTKRFVQEVHVESTLDQKLYFAIKFCHVDVKQRRLFGFLLSAVALVGITSYSFAENREPTIKSGSCRVFIVHDKRETARLGHPHWSDWKRRGKTEKNFEFGIGHP